jgi:hypothetical protein
VYETRDGGRSWKAASSGLGDLEVYALAIDPHAPRRLYAATPSGIFGSADGGRSWGAVGTGLVDAYPRRLADGRFAGCPRG